MEYTTDLLEILNNIDPSLLDYQEWCNVGMALKYEGYTANDWDYWSQRDSKRYHKNECYRKWESFTGSGVTGGTIVQYAKNQGWVPPITNQESGHELGWDDVIEKDEQIIIDKNWIEGREVKEPNNWDPVNELITYLKRYLIQLKMLVMSQRHGLRMKNICLHKDVGTELQESSYNS